MTKKTQRAVLTAVAIIAAYFVGALVGFPSTTGNLGKGDISKVSKYNRISISPASSAFQEKLLNDSLALKETTYALNLLAARMNDFSALVDMTIEFAGDKEELAAEIQNLQKVKTLSENAVQAGKVAVASFDYLVNGQKSPEATDYDQASQNLTVAYLMVDRQVSLGKDFVVAADDFLRTNSVKDNEDIAMMRDLWAEYCAGSAVLNNDKDELAFWSKKTTLTSSEALSKWENKNSWPLYSVGTGSSDVVLHNQKNGVPVLEKHELNGNPVLNQKEQNGNPVLNQKELNGNPVLNQKEMNGLPVVANRTQPGMSVLGKLEQSDMNYFISSRGPGHLNENVLGLISPNPTMQLTL